MIIWVAALCSFVEVHYTSEECCWTSNEVHDVSVQNTVLFIVTTVRTSNPTIVTHVWTFMDVGY
jgi:hypothetical protein